MHEGYITLYMWCSARIHILGHALFILRINVMMCYVSKLMKAIVFADDTLKSIVFADAINLCRKYVKLYHLNQANYR